MRLHWVIKDEPGRAARYVLACGRRTAYLGYVAAGSRDQVTCKQCLRALEAHRGS